MVTKFQAIGLQIANRESFRVQVIPGIDGQVITLFYPSFESAPLRFGHRNEVIHFVEGCLVYLVFKRVSVVGQGCTSVSKTDLLSVTFLEVIL